MEDGKYTIRWYEREQLHPEIVSRRGRN